MEQNKAFSGRLSHFLTNKALKKQLKLGTRLTAAWHGDKTS